MQQNVIIMNQSLNKNKNNKNLNYQLKNNNLNY